MSELVSILTPSYNQGRWLPANLRSVAQQTYPYIEQIVMDGGSTDDSTAILRAAKGNVLWRSEADSGQSAALNKAFTESSGAYIGWLNSDDAYFDRHSVAAAVATFKQHPEVDVVYGHAALVNPEGLIIQVIWVPPFSYRLLQGLNYIIQPTAFIRRSALGRGFVREEYAYCMDREIWLRLGRDHCFRRINRILAVDRHHPNRKSLVRQDLRRPDVRRLVLEYGVPEGAVAAARVKTLKVIFRLVGLSLINAKLLDDNASQAILDSGFHLVVRQALKRRRSMPLDGAHIEPPVN